MRRIALLAVWSGCFSKPGPPGAVTMNDGGVDAAADAPRALDCSGVPFLIGQLLNTDPGFAGDATLSAAGDEIYFSWDADRSDADHNYDIHRMELVNGSFAIDPSPFPFNEAAKPDADAALTEDGTFMAFVREDGGWHVYYSTRPGRGAEWAADEPVPGLSGITAESIDLSPDGLTLYFVDSQGMMRAARRSDRAAAFVVNPLVLGTGYLFPTVSRDGLELYFNDPGGIYTSRAVRNTIGEPWGTPKLELMNMRDPDLSPDGQMLIGNTPARELVLYRRVCR